MHCVFKVVSEKNMLFLGMFQECFFLSAALGKRLFDIFGARQCTAEADLILCTTNICPLFKLKQHCYCLLYAFISFSFFFFLDFNILNTFPLPELALMKCQNISKFCLEEVLNVA